MRIKILLIVFYLLYAWNSTAQFLPLRVGNVWVYECSTQGQFCGGCIGRTKVFILNDSIINGKTYYHCQITNVILNGACNNCGGAIPFYMIRVDSVSANLFQYNGQSCPWSPNEVMLDSFKTRLRDSISVNCSRPNWQQYVCTDTNNIVIFGSSRSRRTYTLNGFESGGIRVYVNGIGLDTAIMNTLEGGTYPCTRKNILKGCVINGVLYGDTSMLVGINKISSEVPDNFSLSQNYPNPFNPNTVIRFQIAGDKFVKLIIYDAIGREVETLVDKKLEPGEYETEFDGTNLPSGVYFYKLSAEGGVNSEQLTNYTETKKMVLIK